MQFHVAQLLKEHTGAVRRFQMNEPIRQLSAEDMTIEAPLTGEVSLMRDTDGILVTGHLETEVSVPCARCLEPVTVPVEMELEEQYYPTIDVETGHKIPVPEDADSDTRIDSHHILDITELVRQSLLLAVPLAPVHPEGCEPVPTSMDDADEPATDPRWAALSALRDKDGETSSDKLS